MAIVSRMAARKQLRRAALGLSLVALAAWRAGHDFALPRASGSEVTSTSRTSTGTQVSHSSSAIPSGLSAPFAGFAGSKSSRWAAISGKDRAAKSTESSAPFDGVSMFLAAAGTATAMRAAAEASKESQEPVAAEEEKSFFDTFKVPIYIGLWYLFNIGYNIYNKKALIAYPYPWAVALWQMAFGWCIFVPLWILRIRKVPKLTVKEAVLLSPSAFGHLATHVGAVIAFFAGAVSFGHIVKASEPVVSSLLNFLFMGELLHPMVYLSLVPIIGGVGLASASELSFNWLCFGAAMGSNFGSAARGVYSKKVMSGGKIGKNMNPSNVYAVLTIMATFLLLPIAFAIEGPTAMLKGFHAAHAAGGVTFLWHMLYSGLFYYLYNEVAFLALGQLDPVSHAVSNTMKRVVIIITAIVVFKNPVTPLGVAGSSIAIVGTLLYSLAKNKFKR